MTHPSSNNANNATAPAFTNWKQAGKVRLAVVACAALLAGVVAALLALEPQEIPNSQGPAVQSTEVVGSIETPSINSNKNAQSNANKNTDALPMTESASNLPLGAPSKSVLAEEAKNDLHATPRSLLEFAEKMAGVMEGALNDKVRAKTAFLDLSECVSTKSPDLPRSIRVICLANAERLSKKYPSEFANDFLNLVNETAPDLLSQAGVAGKGPFGKRQ